MMEFEPNKLDDYLEGAIEYPADASMVVEELGDTRIIAPNLEESRTIGELLAGIESDTYDSADELNKAIHSALPEQYIGRKFYDDRSDNPQDRLVRSDDEDQSF